MNLRCPACGALHSLEILLAAEDAAQAFVQALRAPKELHPLLLRYLALFRPPKRQLQFWRAAQLLEELNPMIEAGSLQRDGVTHAVSLELWADGLDALLAKADVIRPLKDHGLLLGILARKAQALQSSQRDAQPAPERLPASVAPAAAPIPSAPRLDVAIANLRGEIRSLERMLNASPNESLQRQLADKQAALRALEKPT